MTHPTESQTERVRSALSAPATRKLEEETELSIERIARILNWNDADLDEFKLGQFRATAEDCDLNAQYNEDRGAAFRALARLLWERKADPIQKWAYGPAVSPSPPETAANLERTESESLNLQYLGLKLLREANSFMHVGNQTGAAETITTLHLLLERCPTIVAMSDQIHLLRRIASRLERELERLQRAQIDPEQMP